MSEVAAMITAVGTVVATLAVGYWQWYLPQKRLTAEKQAALAAPTTPPEPDPLVVRLLAQVEELDADVDRYRERVEALLDERGDLKVEVARLRERLTAADHLAAAEVAALKNEIARLRAALDAP